MLLFYLGVPALLVLALEGASRLAHPVDRPAPLVADDVPGLEGAMLPDPLLFWRMRPHWEQDGVLLTNSLGLRGPEVLPKAPGEFRILSLGESSTFARQLPAEQSYSSLVEDGLGLVDGRRVTVVNAGVSGYTLFQGLVYLRERGIDLDPDAVMIYFGFNDFLAVWYRAHIDADLDPEALVLTDRKRFALTQTFRFRLAAGLREHSNLFRLLELRGRGAMASLAASSQVRVPEADRRALLLEMSRFCAERGIGLVVVIPWYRVFSDHIEVLRSIRWPEVLVVDLPARLAARKPRRKFFFDDGIHPNAEGHRLIAAEILDVLRAAWSGDEQGRAP